MPAPSISASIRRRRRRIRSPGTEQAAPAQPGAAPQASASRSGRARSADAARRRRSRRRTVDAALAASPRVAIDTPSVGGSINLRGGQIDDVVLKDYHETIDKKSPLIRLFSPGGAPNAYWAETGFVSAGGVKTPNRDTRLDGRRQDADAGPAGDPDLGQRRGPRLQAGRRGRRQVHVHDHGFGRQFRRSRRRRVRPYALILRRGKPNVAGYSVLHEGFVGVVSATARRRCPCRQKSPTRRSTRTPARRAAYKGDGGWLGFTDKYWGSAIIPDQTAPIEARFSAAGTEQPVDYQADFLGAEQTVAPGSFARDHDPRLRRREGSQHDRQLPGQARHQEVRPDDRLGLVLDDHQAAVSADRCDLPVCRQFRRGDPDRDRARQARLLPARQPLLPVDGEDEEDPAADRRAEGPLSRRQGQAAAGADGALQEARASIRSPAACRW